MRRRPSDYDALANSLAHSIRRHRAAFSAGLARHGLLPIAASDAPEYQDDAEPLCYPAMTVVPPAGPSPGSGAVR